MHVCFSRAIHYIMTSALLVCLGCQNAANTFVEPPPPEVTVSLPIPAQIPYSLELTGTTAAIESVEVRARVQGFLEKINFKDGQIVQAGDLLFLIDPRTYQAECDRNAASLAQAKARLIRATSEFNRAADLLPKNAVSKSDYDVALGDRDEAAAAVKMAEANLRSAQLDLEYTKVTAPISGRASRRLVDVGNLVGASDKTLLTTIVNDDSIYAYANISEYDMLALLRKYPRQAVTKSNTPPPEPPKKAVVWLGLADETGYPHEGWLDFFDNQVDPGTGTLRMRAKFPNPKQLLMPGLFVRINIPLDAHAGMYVPDTAVQADQSGRYVLVVNGEDVIEQRPVRISSVVIKNMRAVEEGLTAKDRIVVNNLQRARPGIKVKPVMAETPKGAG